MTTTTRPHDHTTTTRSPSSGPVGGMGTGGARSGATSAADAASSDAARRFADAETPRARVYARWVFMLGKDPARCACGKQRARVIEQALELYDEDTLAMAIDGAAGNMWIAEHQACSSIEWILASESRIERFADEGRAAHERIERDRERARPAAARGAHLRDVDAPATPAVLVADADGVIADPERRAAITAMLHELRGKLVASLAAKRGEA